MASCIDGAGPRAALGCGLLFVATTLSVASRGDWPSARQNPRRTGVASGSGNIKEPSAYWKFFHGGSLGSTDALAMDVDGDGTAEVILASGDGVFAKRPDNGDTVWSNTSVRFSHTDGLSDLDGDGKAELIVHNNEQLFVLRPLDGMTLFTEPAGEMGTLGGVRIADLSGDGVDDVVVHECGCCAINSGKSAVVYSFATGASFSAPKLMWSPPKSFCGGYFSAAVARMRSPDSADFVFGTNDRLQLLDGKSGAVVAEMPPFGTYVQVSRCMPLDVDGDELDEVLCVLIDTSGIPDNGRRAYLLRYAASPSPQLQVVWQALVGFDSGNVRIPPSPVADLDGDGKPELALTGKNAASEWTSYLFDLSTGAKLAQLDGHEVAGTAPIAKGGGQLLLTSKNDALSAWRLDAGELTEQWSIMERTAASYSDLAAGKVGFIAARTLTYDFDGDGIGELVTAKAKAGAPLSLVRAVNGLPEDLASYSPPPGVSAISAWSFPVGVNGAARLALAQSDGNFHLLDELLAPASGNPKVGARFGGFFASSQFRQLVATPIVASFGDGTPGLLAVTSRGALERLDARQASFADPPKVMWSRERTNGALVTTDGAGHTRIAAVERRPEGDDRVVVLAPDGSLVWSKEVKGAVLCDMVYGNLNGDGAPDLIVEHGDLGDSVEFVTALSGQDGSIVWEAPPFVSGNRQPAGGSVADWNADGIDDFVFAHTGTVVLDGKSGQVMVDSSLGGPYHMPILHDVDGDSIDEATLYASFTPAGTLVHDLSQFTWVGGEEDRPLTYGAMVDCPGQGAMLLGGSLSVPSRLSRIVAGGAAGAGTTVHHILASGAIFDSVEAAIRAGADMRQLGTPSIHTNLAGDGVATAVIGSGDGFIYGVEACSGALRFSQKIGAPVGSISFGDTNDDGTTEIIASAADGYLYALRQAQVGSVDEVIDTDPPRGILAEDVDAIVSDDTLYAMWSTVSDATGYEIAVVRDAVDGGGFISAGPWIHSADSTRATLTDLPLEDGKRYFIAVRALKGSERSPDTVSDGVRVTRNRSKSKTKPAPVWLLGRSCIYACTTSRSSDVGGSLSAAGLVFALVVRRRTAKVRLPRPAIACRLPPR